MNFLKFSQFLVLLSLLFCPQNSCAQEDLFAQLEEENPQEEKLLPDQMLLTQRVFWGENGLLRQANLAPLNKTNREKELKIRRNMLTAHQVVGYLTLAGMVAQGILGTELYRGKRRSYETHKMIGNFVTASYFTGASLSLFAPPPLISKKTKGLSSIKAHKWLASVHFSAMIATNLLAEENKKYHRAASYALFASYGTAILVFKF
ncbi:MAG: hypothetical protein ACO3SY_06635 [Flavobacteriaceae bacterium]